MSEKLIFPVPRPDMERYDSMLAAGFDRYPERKANYDKYKSSPRTADINYMPIKADIENVSRCNLHCSHCLVGFNKGRQRAEDMTLDSYKRVIDEQYGLTEIKLQGLGEPLLQSFFPDMISYASDRHIWVRSTTNGMLLHRNDMYKRIIDAGVGEMQVSVDGATKETQERIRINSDFDVIKTNCRKLNEYSQSKGTDMTRMWSVIQSGNMGEAELFINTAYEMGFRRMTLSIELREWTEQNGLNSFIQERRVNHTFSQSMIDSLLEKAEKKGINLTFWNVSERFSRKNICFWPFERFLLSSEMLLVPCCIIADPALLNYGHYDNFREIWFGDVLRNFRKMHLDGEIITECKQCYSDIKG